MSVMAIIKLTAKKGERDTLLDKLQVAVQLTRENSDCQFMKVLLDADDGDVVFFIEQWTSIDAHIDHVQQLEKEGRLETVLEFLSKEIETTHYSEIIE